MKLGEMYYGRGGFCERGDAVRIVGRAKFRGTVLRESAVLCRESAMASMAGQSLDRAIVLFDRVVQLNGELKWPRATSKRLIERKLGKSQDALVLYDEVLNGAARPAEKREAICGRATYFLKIAATDPQNYLRAIEAYDKLAIG